MMKCRPVVKMDKFNKELAKYPSIAVAAKENGLAVSSIHKAISGALLYAKGFKWRYLKGKYVKHNTRGRYMDFQTRMAIINRYIYVEKDFTALAWWFEIHTKTIGKIINAHLQSIAALEAITREETKAIAA